MRTSVNLDGRVKLLFSFLIDYGTVIPLYEVTQVFSKSAKHRNYWAGSMPGAAAAAALGYRVSYNKTKEDGTFLRLYPFSQKDLILARERFPNIDIPYPAVGQGQK